MKIILTRHGRTKENDAGILQGHLEGTLSANGIIQAQKVAQRLKDEIIDYVYSSDLARSANTAREILKYHPKVPVEFTEEMREIYLGKWQGKTKQELGLLNDPIAFERGPDDGESTEEIRVRAQSFLDKLLSKHSEDVVLLVGHNSINKRIVWAITGQEPTENIRNASISVFEMDKTGNAATILLNCTKHLES